MNLDGHVERLGLKLRLPWAVGIAAAALAALAAAAVAFGVLTGGSPSGGGGDEPPKVRIGALYSLSVKNAAVGLESLNGVRFAID